MAFTAGPPQSQDRERRRPKRDHPPDSSTNPGRQSPPPLHPQHNRLGALAAGWSSLGGISAGGPPPLTGAFPKSPASTGPTPYQEPPRDSLLIDAPPPDSLDKDLAKETNSCWKSRSTCWASADQRSSGGASPRWISSQPLEHRGKFEPRRLYFLSSTATASRQTPALVSENQA
jgi:hypothetical protein